MVTEKGIKDLSAAAKEPIAGHALWARYQTKITRTEVSQRPYKNSTMETD